MLQGFGSSRPMRCFALRAAQRSNTYAIASHNSEQAHRVHGETAIVGARSHGIEHNEPSLRRSRRRSGSSNAHRSRQRRKSRAQTKHVTAVVTGRRDRLHSPATRAPMTRLRGSDCRLGNTAPNANWGRRSGTASNGDRVRCIPASHRYEGAVDAPTHDRGLMPRQSSNDPMRPLFLTMGSSLSDLPS